MYWYHHDLSWWGYMGMGAGWFVVWVLVILATVLLVRIVAREPSTSKPPPPPATPAQILAARFAHGEINETEYRERLSVLHDSTRH